MAGEWIKWTVGLIHKDEISGIAERLNRSKYEVAAMCMVFWEWADANVKTSDASATCSAIVRVSSTPTYHVDSLVGVPGFADSLAAVGWIKIRNGSIEFPNFHRHNGTPAKRRLLDAERKRTERLDAKPSKKRDRKACPDSVQEMSEIETDKNGPIEKRRVEESREEKEEITHTLRAREKEPAPKQEQTQWPVPHDMVQAPVAANRIAKIYRDLVKCPHPDGQGRGFLAQKLMSEVWDEKELVKAVENYAESCSIHGVDFKYRLSLLSFFRDELRGYLPGEYTTPEPKRAIRDPGANKGMSKMDEFMAKIKASEGST